MRVVIGRIGRAHGIRGSVSVDVRTDEPELRFAPGTALLTDPESAGPLVIESARWHSGRLLLDIVNISDRTAAEGLRGIVLEAEVADDERPADPTEYYDRQLVGLEARTSAGEVIGTVTEVVHVPSQDLLAVRRADAASASTDPKAKAREEVLIPFVEAIVTEVSLEGGFVTVDAPPGLIDELE